ncbi:MAG TPA: branched-chain amino acid ABC transporter substrate-binding protein [Solirubrobacteraceae bacterium]|jgi:branched-chain amino acid transport system substrate-binding protein|nr:branched-chain amino acid ABC transporter substrate-binding protein [Solirubrobacteraceae bacterium]
MSRPEARGWTGAAAGLATALAGLVLLAGCGTTHPAVVTTTAVESVSVPAARSGEMSIYASVDLDGPNASPSLADAMQLALEQAGGQADKTSIRLVVLDESNANGAADPAAVAAAAHAAASDPTTVAYLGDQTSDDTAIALPILNRAGILEVSPTATYGGLTRGSADPSEPAKYYPSGRRTFARVVPSDNAQAAAQASYEHTLGCTHVSILDDGTLYGRGLAASFATDAKAVGLAIVGSRAISTAGTQYGTLAAGVAGVADCVLFIGDPAPGVAALFGALHAAGPQLKLFGTDALATQSFAASLGSAHVATHLTAPTLDPSFYGESGDAFYEAYGLRFGGPPDSSAIFGYEAMNAVLSAIDAAGSRSRAAIVDAFFNINNRVSPLGTYSIDADGDTTLNRYGSFLVVDSGLQFDTVLPTSLGAAG